MKLLMLVAVFLAFYGKIGEARSIKNATLHLLPDAESTYGAVCLDGSPAGYYLRKGSGEGADKWILHLQGGGWCNNTESCSIRKDFPLGSSKHWPKSRALNGFLSDNSTVNPDFYNWNIVYVMYCDGAFFSGYVKNPVMYNETSLFFRGRANLKASLEDLLSNGLDKATDVILTGCSAGGLAVYLHADTVQSYLPKTVKKYKAFSDAGFFIDTENINGVNTIRMAFQNMFEMQNGSGGVNQDCLNHRTQTDMWQCMFPEYTYEYIKTPIFVLNSMYDTAQLNGLFGLPCLPPHNCSRANEEEFYDFAVIFLATAEPVLNSSTDNGYYFDSCEIHCQTIQDVPWSSVTIGNTTVTIRESFAHWYKEDTRPGVDTRLRDCQVPFNCNRSCPRQSRPGPNGIKSKEELLKRLLKIVGSKSQLKSGEQHTLEPSLSKL